MFFKLLVEKRCAVCKRRLKESLFDKPFSIVGLSFESDSTNLAICNCEKAGKTLLVSSACMRVLQSVVLLVISLVMTATLIVIRDSPILNTDRNSVLNGYELSINDVNRIQNYQDYDSYLSQQFRAEGFDLNRGRVDLDRFHYSFSDHSLSDDSRQIDASGSIEK